MVQRSNLVKLIDVSFCRGDYFMNHWIRAVRRTYLDGTLSISVGEIWKELIFAKSEINTNFGYDWKIMCFTRLCNFNFNHTHRYANFYLFHKKYFDLFLSNNFYVMCLGYFICVKYVKCLQIVGSYIMQLKSNLSHYKYFL